MPYLKPISIFISYSKDDVDYLREIRGCINLQSLTNITVWDDGKIEPGINWDDEIRLRLNRADIILLLLSRSFFNTNYIIQTELDLAFKRLEEGICVIIPVFIRDCEIRDERIQSLQGLPRKMNFLGNFPLEKRDPLYREVEIGIGTTVNKLRTDARIDVAGRDDREAGHAQAVAIISEQKLEKRTLVFDNGTDFSVMMKDSLFVEAQKEHEYKKWDFSLVDFLERRSMDMDDISIFLFFVFIFTSEEEMANGVAKQYFDLLSIKNNRLKYNRMIVWVSSNDLFEKLPIALKTSKVIIGLKRSELVDAIKTLEQERQRAIAREKSWFSPQVELLFLYNWEKDHPNDVRKLVKRNIEQRTEIMPEYPSPDPSVDSIENQLKRNKAVILFYGDTDAKWYCYWQAQIQKTFTLRARAACVTSPNKEDKLDSDVNRRAFYVIDDNNIGNDLIGFFEGLI